MSRNNKSDKPAHRVYAANKDVEDLENTEDEENIAQRVNFWGSNRKMITDIKENEEKEDMEEVCNVSSLSNEFDFKKKVVKYAQIGKLGSKHIQKVPITEFAPIKALPLKNFYLRIPHNIHTKDAEVLYNIPYLGDEVIDSTFMSDYLGNYDEKLHVTSEEADDNNNLLSGPTVRTAFNPNIDGPNVSSLSCNPDDDKPNAFKALFCRKCFLYDCMIHREDPIPKTKRPFPELAASTESCGSNCYKLMNKSFNQEEMEIRELLIEPDEIWTGSDQSFFRCLQKVFLRNYCAIAKTMMTKTCRQVYEFAKKEGDYELPKEVKTKDLPKSKTNLRNYKQLSMIQAKRNINALLPHYIACDHKGRTCDKNCSCIESGNFCEKFCNCSDSCKNRFQGCKCKKHCTTKQCACRFANRECDPDICKVCKAGEFEVKDIVCKNVSIQRKLRLHLAISPSNVSGWGAFLLGTAQKNQFITEYCGEMISFFESERRGKLYDKQGCSYLFDLNNKFVLDATHKGNKARFINHSSKNPNCYPKVVMVIGDCRIGIFALKELKYGDELFFDYKYLQDKEQFVAIER